MESQVGMADPKNHLCNPYNPLYQKGENFFERAKSRKFIKKSIKSLEIIFSIPPFRHSSAILKFTADWNSIPKHVYLRSLNRVYSQNKCYYSSPEISFNIYQGVNQLNEMSKIDNT